MVAFYDPAQEDQSHSHRTTVHKLFTSSAPGSQILQGAKRILQGKPKGLGWQQAGFQRPGLVWAALYAEVFGLLETPRRSKMAWLQEWPYLLTLEGIREVSPASCAFGSIRQKEFRFLTANTVPDSVSRRCSRDHSHVKIEGQLTKGTAVYCPGLVRALGQLFHVHLSFEASLHQACDIDVQGLAEPLVNEIIRCEAWKIDSCWKWTGMNHINILELASYLASNSESGSPRRREILFSSGLLSGPICSFKREEPIKGTGTTS